VDDSLVNAIHAAFPAGVPPARPVTGHRCKECDETDRLLGGRTWVDVAADFPQYCHDTFLLLTPAAKAYYLPAYMCFEARSPGYMAGVSVSDTLERGELDPASFTEAQRAAVWAWAEAYYGPQPRGFPPDSVAEAWWLGGG
jgi:hypothetical protein